MLFNSYEFIFAFLPITLASYLVIARYYSKEFSFLWLVIASLFFYGWWNPAYLALIIFSMVFNYAIGNKIHSLQKQNNQSIAKYTLIIGVTINLALLGYFKYANFFIDNLNIALDTGYQIETIILPLAISFFTFQQISYLADSYYRISKEHNFLHYALFVTFFPQLIAGPIVHHKEMLPQFTDSNNSLFSYENIVVGLTIFAIGLFKKAVLADGIAPYSSSVFLIAETTDSISFFIAWGGALAYTLQLYFDFSGYSDMAIGIARLFGIKLPLNFFSPYKATSIIDFWRRWHMTLSRFLRDYLYIPLGGNKKGTSRRYINLFITMILGGLWHGAGWTFIIWGALHGLYLTINHIWVVICKKLNINLSHSSLWAVFAWGLTFIAVVIGWVFFRAESVTSALNILSGMAGMNGVSIPNAIASRIDNSGELFAQLNIGTFIGGGSQFILTYLWVISLGLVAILLPNTAQLMKNFNPTSDSNTPISNRSLPLKELRLFQLTWAPTTKWSIVLSIILSIGIFSLSSVSEFLYFQF